MSADERIERARRHHERSIFGGDSSQLAAAIAELDAVEAEVAMVRGRVIHAGFLDRRRAGQEAPAEGPRELELFVQLITLAEIVAGEEGKAAGLALLDEAEAVAREGGANGILGWASEAREELMAVPEA